MDTSALADTSFEDFQSPAHRDWIRLRGVMQEAPLRVTADRGYMGVGAIVTDDGHLTNLGDRLLVRNAAFKVLTLKDLPGSRRERHLAAVYQPRLHYGMPALRDPIAQFDFRRMPFHSIVRNGTVVLRPDDVLDSETHAHWFKAFNALNKASLSAAVRTRPSWQPLRRAMLRAFNLEGITVPLLLGNGPRLTLERPEEWAPRPYIAFRAALRNSLYGAVTRFGILRSGEPYWPVSFRREFCADLERGLPVFAPHAGTVGCIQRGGEYEGTSITEVVLKKPGKGSTRLRVPAKHEIAVKVCDRVEAGQLLARADVPMPEDWERMSLAERWDHGIPRLIPRRRLDVFLEIWFRNQMIDLGEPAYFHVPAVLAATAAYLHGVPRDEQLWWDVSPSLPYFDDEVDAFVFPPIKTSRWDEFRFTVGDAIDLSIEPRCRPPEVPCGTKTSGS